MELAHMIIEAKKLQDLDSKLKSWGVGVANK